MATLQRWTARDGQEWACGAYDHGPLCRLCQPVDETTRLVLANVDAGMMEFSHAEGDGTLKFRLTEAGQQRADALIADTPEGFDLAMRFRMRHD